MFVYVYIILLCCFIMYILIVFIYVILRIYLTYYDKTIRLACWVVHGNQACLQVSRTLCLMSACLPASESFRTQQTNTSAVARCSHFWAAACINS